MKAEKNIDPVDAGLDPACLSFLNDDPSEDIAAELLSLLHSRDRFGSP